MAKKKTPKSELSESVHKIWLAGLGAMATAEEEGGKLFSSLVDRGKKYESTIKKPVGQATTQVKKKVKDVRGRAGKTVKKIERAFDEQVDAALHRVGVPTRKEIAALNRKVQRLTEAIEGKRRKAAKKKTPAKKTTARKKTATK
jgi:poly(hydroxyalkanoate) granule-associated protein